MSKVQRVRVLTSLLWGAVAAVGQYTMLFLTIVWRIRVRIENGALLFHVDPRGPIPLSKDAALTSAWVMTVLYGLIVGLAEYVRPRLARRTWIILVCLAVTFSVIAALAEPLWGLIIFADFIALCTWLTREAQA